jgi:hypothetical protein
MMIKDVVFAHRLSLIVGIATRLDGLPREVAAIGEEIYKRECRDSGEVSVG